MKDPAHLEAACQHWTLTVSHPGYRIGSFRAVLCLLFLGLAVLMPAGASGLSGDPYRAGIEAFERGHVAEALQLFQQAAQLHPQDARVANALGNAWLASGQPSKARQEYLRAIALDPRLMAARKNLGVLEYQQGHFAAAERQLAAVTEAMPADAVAWRFLGLTLAASGKAQEALLALQRSLAIDSAHPASPEVIAALAQAYLQIRQPDQAIATVESALPGASDKAALYDLLGWINQQAGHANEAGEAYRQAILADPKRPVPYLQLSWLYAEFRHFDEGAQTLREGLRFVTDPLTLKLQLGTILVLGGHEQEAEPILQQAIAAQPHNPAGYTTLIINYTLLDPSYDRPLQVAQKALEECPDNYLTHYLYAGLLFRMHRQDIGQAGSAALVQKIKSELKESIRLNPDFPHSSYDLARVEFETANYPAAERDARAALAADSGFSEARYLLGRIHLKEGRKAEGDAEIAQVEQQHVEDIRSVAAMGQTLLARQAADAGSRPPALSSAMAAAGSQ